MKQLAEDDNDVITITIGFKTLLAVIGIALLIGGILFSYISSLATYIAPSQDYPLYIQNVFTADQNGNPKTTFYRGQIVLVNVTIEMAMQYYYQYYYYTENYYYTETGYFEVPTRFLVLIQIFYRYRPLYLGFVVAELSPGECKSYGIGFSLPETASLGDYTVEVMVWSNWLDKGGVALASNSGLEITFRVEG